MNFRSSRNCDFHLGNCAPTHPCLGEISQKNNMRNATTINVGAGNWNRTCRRGSSSLTWLSHLLAFCTLFPQTWTSRHGRYKRETGKPDTSHLLGDDVAGGTFLRFKTFTKLTFMCSFYRWSSPCWAPWWWQQQGGSHVVRFTWCLSTQYQKYQ